MKKSTKIIRLSVTFLLLIAMLLTPMSPVFAVSPSKCRRDFSVFRSATLHGGRKIVRKDEAQTSFPTISDVSMQDSLMHMVDILLSYVFSTNPGVIGKIKKLFKR